MIPRFIYLLYNKYILWILECLATIVGNIDAEQFKPLAPNMLQVALKIMEENDDPDVRKAVFGLYAALATVMKNDLTPVLQKIIEQLIGSIQSSEGIVVSNLVLIVRY